MARRGSRRCGKTAWIRARSACSRRTSIQWSPSLRTTVGLRGDVYRSHGRPEGRHDGWPEVRHRDSALVSPKLSVVIGPGAEPSSMSSRYTVFTATTARRVVTGSDDSTTRSCGHAARKFGVRTVRDPARAEDGVAVATRYRFRARVRGGCRDDRSHAAEPPHRSRMGDICRPRPWLVIDGDVAVSRAKIHRRRSGGRSDSWFGPVGDLRLAPRFDDVKRMSGSIRLRFISAHGSLAEDDSMRSSGHHACSTGRPAIACERTARVVLEFFNLLNVNGERHRLFLHVAAPRRASRWRCRRPHPPGTSALGPRHAAGSTFSGSMALVQTSISSGVIVPSGTSRAST